MCSQLDIHNTEVFFFWAKVKNVNFVKIQKKN